MHLLITLGHNSSAILLDNSFKIIMGYEEERLTRIKSDSAFPKNAIEKIIESDALKFEDNLKIYISHWFDDFEFWKYKIDSIEKYYDYEYMNSLCKKYNGEIISLNEKHLSFNGKFTHHDAHAYSAQTYLENYTHELNDWHIIVADGFGNNEEVITIYESHNRKIEVIDKFRGYEKSLGLFYQYATSYCGMKENQDEYKFLGYESKFADLDFNAYTIMLIEEDIRDTIEILRSEISIMNNTNKDFINIDKLKHIKSNWHNYFDFIFKKYLGRIEDQNVKRIFIGYFVQRVVESYLRILIETYNIKKVLLVGGLFYNVKLNNSIMRNVDKICVMPLAGDQGAAIGFIRKLHDKTVDLTNLCIGTREHNFKKRSIDLKSSIHFSLFALRPPWSKINLVDNIIKDLLNNEIVQVIIGKMEFGPRALCNTSTLAIPYQENIEKINAMNNRNTIMPMAPVMTKEAYYELFADDQTSKVIGSHQHMIITLDYKNPEELPENLRGVSHNYPNSNLYSGRPQVVESGYIYEVLKVLEDFGIIALVNTSFNFHGEPIIYNFDDAIKTYQKQVIKCLEMKIKPPKLYTTEYLTNL